MDAQELDELAWMTVCKIHQGLLSTTQNPAELLKLLVQKIQLWNALE
jgi:hypothetical protein